MFSPSPRAAISLFGKLCGRQFTQQRQVQVTIVGAANDIGSNLALMVKNNPKVSKLNLYDEDERTCGVALELCLLPGGPQVTAFSGHKNLCAAITDSNLIVMVTRIPRKPGITREQMLVANAPRVQHLCKAMVQQNPNAFLAISTNPINSIVPYASAILYKNNSYNPYKVFGITQIDAERSKAFTASMLNVSARDLEIPVIGGHSEETLVPLFSNIKPASFGLDSCQADLLTRLVKKAGSEVVVNKNGTGSAGIAMAWSVNEFVNGLVDALCGYSAHLNCYTANPNFGTRFFSGPNVVGPEGLSQTCAYTSFQISPLEQTLLSDALRALNKDIAQGEDYARIFA